MKRICSKNRSSLPRKKQLQENFNQREFSLKNKCKKKNKRLKEKP
jgi:hypothetical protein